MTPWTFAFVSDIHVGTPRSYRYAPAWNANWRTARQQIIDLDPEFLLVGGDLTRDGSTHRYEMEQIKADLDSLPFPVHIIPGNHEVGNKYHPDSSVSIQPDYVALYRSVFGSSQWSFVHRDVRFSGFDSFLAGSGLPEEAEMWAWLEAQRDQPPAKHHVWIMHQALFVNELNEPNWDITEDRNAWYFSVDEPYRSRIMDVFRATGATLVITGHIHCRRQEVADGILFQYAPATAFPQWADRWPDGDATLGFLRCEVSDAGIEPHFVPLAEQSTESGYGPGGNPALEGRDYSVAWQKPSIADIGLDAPYAAFAETS